ncbi:hypothetical protein CLOM_g1388 [Closterium sp. NIES-68]|nr:hypothetical protein CLOM_g1388 [Closterium sp. NIES-68]
MEPARPVRAGSGWESPLAPLCGRPCILHCHCLKVGVGGANCLGAGAKEGVCKLQLRDGRDNGDGLRTAKGSSHFCISTS